MLEELWEYTITLYKEVPASVYKVLLALLCIGVVVIICIRGLRKGWRNTCLLLLAEYVFLLFGSTVLFRNTSNAILGHDFHPFWSYRSYFSGDNSNLLVENIMNVLVFVPLGFLFGIQLSQKFPKGWSVALGLGFLISVSIETLQYFLNRGFSEVDDVIHNTIGCILGYILVKGSQVMVIRRAKRQSRTKD